MIKVEQLSFKSILKDISFELPQGKTMAVIGHNGAGKTTLFHVLLGLKFLSHGSFMISDQKFGYVPERPYLSLEESLGDFLKLHLNLINFKDDFSLEMARVLKIVGLDAKLNSQFKTFSKGMLQKALIAQAILGNPKLLILDEPMSGLDPGSREDLKNTLLNLKSAGITLVFSSHVMEDVSALADCVLTLDHGAQKSFEVMK